MEIPMEEKLYTIGHVCLMTGLSDRTIRSYIAMGLLKGEKINGLWHFSGEQVDAFVRHPKVLPSIRAKCSGMVQDCLIDEKKRNREICLVLDLPGVEDKTVTDWFCSRISFGLYENIRFSFNCFRGTPRVILKGKSDSVLELARDFQLAHPEEY